MSTTGATLHTQRTKKAATIEFWRFAFTLLVLIYHLELSYSQRSLLLTGASAVEFFFILSGFLMAKSAHRINAERTEACTVREAHLLALDFVKKKLKAIYPILIVVMLFWAVGVMTAPESTGGASGGFDWGGGAGGGFDWGGGGAGGGFDWGGGGTGGGFDWGAWGGGGTGGGFDWSAWGPQTPPEAPFITKLKTIMNTEYILLMMIGTPAGFWASTEAIPMWFLTALLIIGYLYTFAINKRYDIMAFLAPALGILCWIFFGLTATAGILDSSTRAGFLNTGMVKAISEMSFGVCMFMVYNYLSQKNLSTFTKVLLSILEAYAILRFCMLTFNQPSGNNNYLRLIYIMIIVLLSFMNVTLISRLLDRVVFRWLGSISLAMYISHYYLKNFFVEKVLKIDSFMITGKMPVKDMILYCLLVIAASALIMLYVWFIKRFVIKPLKERKAAKAAAIEQTEPAPTV